MIVGFHLKCNAPIITNVDDASVFARRHDHPRAAGRKSLQMNTRRLVRTMLRPHYAKNAQLRDVGFAAENIYYLLVFARRQAVLFYDFGSNNSFGHHLFGSCTKNKTVILPRTATLVDFSDRWPEEVSWQAGYCSWLEPMVSRRRNWA